MNDATIIFSSIESVLNFLTEWKSSNGVSVETSDGISDLGLLYVFVSGVDITRFLTRPGQTNEDMSIQAVYCTESIRHTS